MWTWKNDSLETETFGRRTKEKEDGATSDAAADSVTVPDTWTKAEQEETVK